MHLHKYLSSLIAQILSLFVDTDCLGLFCLILHICVACELKLVLLAQSSNQLGCQVLRKTDHLSTGLIC
jgi:hypothetical protein